MKNTVKKVLITGIIALCSLSFVGCKDESEEKSKDIVQNETNIDPNKIPESELTDQTYYIYHQDGSIEPVYFGSGTVEYGDTRGGNDRVMWFKEDVANIPTYYTGRDDSLIYYSTEPFNEQFTFTRYLDLGYTVGIRGLSKTKSGRYSLDTNVGKNTTYPGGDTDILLTDFGGKTALFDQMNGMPFQGYDKDGDGIREEQPVLVSDYGTLIYAKYQLGIQNFDIYEGTLKRTYKFMTDVYMLGAEKSTDSYNYKFVNSNLIQITIPNEFQTGYYNINGTGVFRYVVGTDYTDSTDFNLGDDVRDPFEAFDNNGNQQPVNDKKIVEETTVTSKFYIEEPANIGIEITFTFGDNYINEGLITASLQTPDGQEIPFYDDENGVLKATIENASKGAYVIKYQNLNTETVTPNVNVYPIENN